MILCKNHDDAVLGCLGMADDRYTMDFGDVEPGAKLYWCANCGPVMHAMVVALQDAFETRSDFADELQEAIRKLRGETPDA